MFRKTPPEDANLAVIGAVVSRVLSWWMLITVPTSDVSYQRIDESKLRRIYDTISEEKDANRIDLHVNPLPLQQLLNDLEVAHVPSRLKPTQISTKGSKSE